MNELPLVVLDLDFTVWDAGGTWCDHLDPPFTCTGGKVADRHGRHVRLYPDLQGILDDLTTRGHTLAVASRTGQPKWARQLLDMLEIRHYFHHEEIYPGSKVTHFDRIRQDSGVPYQRMIFFDDEHRNIAEVGALGVHAVHVPRGLTAELVTSALRAPGG